MEAVFYVADRSTWCVLFRLSGDKYLVPVLGVACR
jgi:hypothetical protein